LGASAATEAPLATRVVEKSRDHHGRRAAAMKELLSFSLLSLSAIFFVVDPMGVIPIFVAMTRDDSEEKKADMAYRASVAAFGILTSFAIAGTFIFKVLGVTLGAFKVAGGILLLITSVEMLRATQTRTRMTPEEGNAGAEREDIAIFPLAIPLLAGPGSIATVTALMGRAGKIIYAIPVVLSIAVTCVASYAMLRAAGRIAHLLGVTGLSVMNRVIGLIIGAIAVQFIFDGLRDTFPRVLG
jgi:multiple antibiotic resistance protein